MNGEQNHQEKEGDSISLIFFCCSQKSGVSFFGTTKRAHAQQN
jgi:hypothetical protein